MRQVQQGVQDARPASHTLGHAPAGGGALLPAVCTRLHPLRLSVAPPTLPPQGQVPGSADGSQESQGISVM